MTRYLLGAGLCGLALLASCGGGGGGGSGGGDGAGGKPTTASATVTAASPKVELSGVAVADFSSAAELQGQTVTVAKLTDDALNDLAENSSAPLNASFPDPTTVTISTRVAPAGDTVVATLSVGTDYANAGEDQFPFIYVATAEGDDDGGMNLAPLNTTYDDVKGTLTATLPAIAFQGDSSGYTAALKVGLATTASTPISMSAARSHANALRPQAEASTTSGIL